jgi:hypothetical protein
VSEVDHGIVECPKTFMIIIICVALGVVGEYLIGQEKVLLI